MIIEAHKVSVIRIMEFEVKGSRSLINLAYISGEAIQLKFSICEAMTKRGEWHRPCKEEQCKQVSGTGLNGCFEMFLLFQEKVRNKLLHCRSSVSVCRPDYCSSLKLSAYVMSHCL